MTDHSSVIREKRGQAFWITINRPDKRNAINDEMRVELTEAFPRFDADPVVRVVHPQHRSRVTVAA